MKTTFTSPSPAQCMVKGPAGIRNGVMESWSFGNPNTPALQHSIVPRRRVCAAPGLAPAANTGSVLVVTMVMSGILVMVMGIYLYMASTESRLLAQSQAWNAAIPLAEAGIEEGMAQINVNAGDYGFNNSQYAATNFVLSAINNFGQVSGGFYPAQTRYLTNGSYSVTIGSDWPPTLFATGYTSVALVGRQVHRTVQVKTGMKMLFEVGIVALTNINMSGNTLTIDGYDSSDPAHNTNGFYCLCNRLAAGDIASSGGLLAVQNANIYGHMFLGPTASYSVGANGLVGDLNWTGPGVEPGWLIPDWNMDFTDVVPPYTTGLTPGSQGTNTYWLGSNDYYISGDFKIKNNQTMYVAGNARFYVTGSFTMANNSSSQIVIATNATLQLFAGAPTGSTTIDLTSVIAPGPAATFQVYGLPSAVSMSWNGNGAYLGTIYAPETTLTLGGGGNNIADFQGGCVVQTLTMNGKFQFHYDKALQRFGPANGFRLASWQEL